MFLLTACNNSASVLHNATVSPLPVGLGATQTDAYEGSSLYPASKPSLTVAGALSYPLHTTLLTAVV